MEFCYSNYFINTNKHTNKEADSVQKTNAKGRMSGAIIAAILALSSVISLFYGASFYKSETQKFIDLANARAKQFEVVFNELLKARFRAMGIAADTLLQSKVTMEPFVNRDRAALGARVDPYFALLQKRHGVEQLNFWLPPATMLYRGRISRFGSVRRV